MAKQSKRVAPGILIQLVIVLLLLPLSPMLISGRWRWAEAWVYFVLVFFGFVVSRALAARRHPDLLSERAHSAERKDTKPWDRVLAPVVALGSGVLPAVAGVEARLGELAAYPAGVKVLAVLAILGGYALSTYALIENRFFSGVVRIQQERGHHVVSSGPYAWVRHPGYLGALVACWATPLLLDSRWAFVLAGLLTVAIVVRTALEDRTLQEELPGYREYAQRVRYRLIPGVW